MTPSSLRRQRRIDQTIREVHQSLKGAGKKKLEDQIGYFGNESDVVREMRFHPHEPYLIVADQTDGVTVWNWTKSTRVNRFHQDPIRSSRITDFQIINDQSENSILLVSNASGNIHLYKDYEKNNEQYLVTAIRAEPMVMASSRGPGILTEWQQDHGLLYVSGDVPHIKVWDMERETCVQTISSDIDACTTSLGCDRMGGHSIVAGYSDGSVLIFDRRENNRQVPLQQHSLQNRMKEHKNWVVKVCIQKVNNNQIITGSYSGDIKFWDARVLGGAAIRTFECHKGGMNSLEIHDYAPVMACGSNDQFIKVFNTSGDQMSMIYYHEGFLGQRIGPVSSLAFHPYRMLLAAGSTDSIISIYSGDRNQSQKGRK
ncbi:raptor [Acrasis kona]|uniref:Raptor n=1 Tax=Acrasis kona TaxID=1008807 RepID=A0AAW2YW03_9EUKA